MEGSIDSTTLTALAVTLTAVGGVATVLAYRRRGAALGLRLLALTLLPMAALLTGSLRLVVGIASDIAGWAARLVFSPVVWVGVSLAGLAVVLYVAGGIMSARGIGVTGRRAEPAVGDDGVRAKPAKPVTSAGPATSGTAPAQDEGMDEIEAILRKHGI